MKDAGEWTTRDHAEESCRVGAGLDVDLLRGMASQPATLLGGDAAR